LSLPIASFKLRFDEAHVRALPANDEDGRPFEGPGIDLRGEAARAAFAAAAPVVSWFTAREPGVRVRSLSLELATGRVLATIADTPRPRVVRVDPPASVEIVDAARPLLAYLGEAAREALRKRT
jgi:hypothetical protein